MQITTVIFKMSLKNIFNKTKSTAGYRVIHRVSKNTCSHCRCFTRKPYYMYLVCREKRKNSKQMGPVEVIKDRCVVWINVHQLHTSYYQIKIIRASVDISPPCWAVKFYFNGSAFNIGLITVAITVVMATVMRPMLKGEPLQCCNGDSDETDVNEGEPIHTMLPSWQGAEFAGAEFARCRSDRYPWGYSFLILQMQANYQQ